MQRITTNVAWSSQKPFFGSTDRNPRPYDQRQKDFTSRSGWIGKTEPDLGWRLCRHSCEDLVVAGNADVKHPCLGNGKTVLMRTPTQVEFVEYCSEAIIRNGLPPALVDDLLFRKTLVTTSRIGQTAVCMGKGTVLGIWKEGHFDTSSYIHQENHSGDRQKSG